MAGRDKGKAVRVNEKQDSPVIELSTVCFYGDSAPQVIALRDCGLPMESPIPGALSAFYGSQSKQEGFMAARAYANAHRLQFTVVDFLVRLDVKQNPLSMKPEDLSEFDFLAFQRLSRSMRDELGEIFRKKLIREGVDTSDIDFSKPQLLVMQRPELIKVLMNRADYAHLKVIAHPAKLKNNESSLIVGAIPHRHWGAIHDAACRLNPNIQITLDAPGRIKKQERID
jgi:hypothetical protein